MSEIRFNKIWIVAKTEFIKWITNPRIIIVFIMFVFIKMLATDPLLERAEKMGLQLNVLEPFIAIMNSSTLLMFMPCVYLLLISDFPVICGYTLFTVKRAGKYNWFFGQLLFIVMSITAYILIIFIAGLVMSKGSFSLEWSDAVTKYDIFFPDEFMNFAWFLVPPNLYNQIPVITAAIQSSLLIFAYLSLLALILSFFKLLYMRSMGLFSAFTIIAAGVTATAVKADIMWAFPMANSIIWLHYKEVLREPITPVSTSFIYFAVLINSVLIANLFVLRRLQFTNLEQEIE